MPRMLGNAVLGTMLLVCAGLARPQSSPDYGGVNAGERRFISGYFGFSYRFPEGWTGHASYGAMRNASTAARFVSLFTASPTAASANEVRYIGIQADDVAHGRDIHSAKDFLDLSLKTLAGPAGAFDAEHQGRAVYGGRQFIRQDLRSKDVSGMPSFYQTQLVTLLRDHAITFSFIAANRDDLEELVRTAESLNFFEPGSVPVPAPVATQVAIAQPAAPASAAQPVIPVAPAEPQVTTVVVTARSVPERAEAAPEPATAAAPQPTTAASVMPEPATEVVTVHPAKPQPVTPPPAATKAATSTTPLPLMGRPAASAAPVTPPPPAPVVQAAKVSQASYRPAPASAPASVATAPAATAQAQLVSRSATNGLSQPLYGAGNTEPAAYAAVVNISAPAQSVPSQAFVTQPAPQPQAPEPAQARAANFAPPAPEPVAAVSAPPTPSRIRVAPVSFRDYIASKSAVTYPEMAKLQRVEGEVLLDVVVGPDGKLKDVQALSGPTLLRPGAVDAVKHWRFKPYVIDGAPVEVESTVSLNFRLNQ